MAKEFAPEYPRDENNWIKFPRDDTYRKQMFPPEVNKHPAKANVFMIQSIIEYVSEPGQTIMDVMAGTGTLMVGALINRTVICIEISEKFYNMQVKALEKLEEFSPGISDYVMLINLPCQRYLPIPNMVDHIVFSPQYAGIMRTKGTDKWNQDTAYDFIEYSKSPLNLGTMTEFEWAREMEKVYTKCFQTIRPGGSMTLILKDHMGRGKRIGLTQRGIDGSIKAGFTHDLTEHFKWATPGMPYTMDRKMKGIEVVLDEDIVVLRKPNEKME